MYVCMYVCMYASKTAVMVIDKGLVFTASDQTYTYKITNLCPVSEVWW